MIHREVYNMSCSARWTVIAAMSMLMAAPLRASEDSFVLRAGTLITAKPGAGEKKSDSVEQPKPEDGQNTP